MSSVLHFGGSISLSGRHMNPTCDIVMAVNYYAPYVSGLTDTARLVAESLAASGHRVVVVCCRHDSSLPVRETLNGVEVVRTRVIGRIGKGLISPAFIFQAIRHGRRSRVVNLHMPMIESGAIALGVRGIRLVLTYQCDISLPRGFINSLQTWVMDASNALAMAMADVIVPSSADYARFSRLKRAMREEKLVPISPPSRLQEGGSPKFRVGPGLHVGFLGRIVEEKGVEFLVDGFRALDDPNARLLIAGDFSTVAGGSVIDKVRRHIEGDPRIVLLGFLADSELADFYASIDIFALPSINSFEAFGIVQVEAMRVGVAALASNLPGVRTPVQNTGFGVIVEPRDASAITDGLKEIATQYFDREQHAAASSLFYSLERTSREYAEVFNLRPSSPPGGAHSEGFDGDRAK